MIGKNIRMSQSKDFPSFMRHPVFKRPSIDFCRCWLNARKKCLRALRNRPRCRPPCTRPHLSSKIGGSLSATHCEEYSLSRKTKVNKLPAFPIFKIFDRIIGFECETHQVFTLKIRKEQAPNHSSSMLNQIDSARIIVTSEPATPQNEFLVQRFCCVRFALASCNDAVALISGLLEYGTEAPADETLSRLRDTGYETR